jgi:Flp pilus assembly protein TadD
LKTLDEADPKVCYLMAVIYSRLGQDEMAERYFRQSLSYDPYLKFRANLDPEMARFAAALENEY